MKKEELYIINESPEIGIGESPNWLRYITRAFPALRYPNYRLYFMGQLVSLIGTWLQTVAQGYLVYELTRSAFWVGLIAALNFLPVMLFSLFGGVVVDRFKKRSILYVTQTVQMGLAFVLGGLVLGGVVNEYHIAFLAFLLGCSSAVDMPARQTFVNDIVDRKYLASAISLNAGVFNAARAVGPAFAGLLISYVGVGGAFILNGFTFIAIIVALSRMKIQEYVHPTHPHPIKAIMEGLRYSFSNPIIRPLLILAAFNSIFGWSYITVMPVVARDIYKVGAAGLGYLQSAAGVGAMLGAVLISIYSRRVKANNFIFGGTLLFVSALFIFSFVHTLPIGMLTLFFTGLGIIAAFSMTNSTIQHQVPDAIRGRVMSIYTLMFLGMSPLGSIEIGYLSEVLGVHNALRINACIMLIFSAVLYISQKELRSK